VRRYGSLAQQWAEEERVATSAESPPEPLDCGAAGVAPLPQVGVPPPSHASVARRPAAASRAGALADPRYRRYWFGSLASIGATQLVTMAQGWLIVFELDASPLALGFVGAATAVPTIGVNLFGGVLADRLDRRRLLLLTSLLTMALLAVLTALDATGAVRIWHIIVIAAGLGLVYGIDWPARNAFFPALITRDQTASAVALNAMLWQGTRIVAPAIGGVLIAVADTSVVFALSMVGTLAMFAVLLTLRVEAPPAPPRRRVREELGEGLRFIAGERLFLLLILLTYAGMFFGMQYVPLMPLMADAFDVGSGRLGLLFTMIGLGSVGGTFVSMRLNRSDRQGQVMLGAVMAASLLVIGFALAPMYEVSLLFIGGVALANAVFSISTMTALQLRVPDALRGRVMGIHSITFSLIPLGGLLGGALASLIDVRFALALSAAVLMVLIAAVATTQPTIRGLTSRDL